MITTRTKFGLELKKKVLARQDLKEIGNWAYDIFLDYPNANDVNFLKVLLTINKMELGPEFYFSYEELDSIANDLIVNKDIDI